MDGLVLSSDMDGQRMMDNGGPGKWMDGFKNVCWTNG